MRLKCALGMLGDDDSMLILGVETLVGLKIEYMMGGWSRPSRDDIRFQIMHICRLKRWVISRALQ